MILTLKMTTAQVIETSVTVNNNSPIQDYVHPDDHTQPAYLELSCVVTTIGNCPPTPPLSQHFALSEKLSVNVGLGEG